MSVVLEHSDVIPKPRAVILDLFGGYLRARGGSVKAGSLMTLLGEFGVEPATVRVTLSRLRRENWFTTRRTGRETVYTLTEQLNGILEEGHPRIFATYDEPWDGRWTTVVHGSGLDRATRDGVRKRLAWLGFGPLSGTTWISPRDRRESAGHLREEFGDVVLTVMRSSTDRVEEDCALAERCWDLQGINELYQEFLTAFEPLLAVVGEMKGADALVARIALISNYRRFPFLDPWLPTELRPGTWLGARANAVFHQLHDALESEAQRFVDSVLEEATTPGQRPRSDP